MCKCGSSGKVGTGPQQGHSPGTVALAAAVWSARGHGLRPHTQHEAVTQHVLRQSASLPFKLQRAMEGKRTCNN